MTNSVPIGLINEQDLRGSIIQYSKQPSTTVVQESLKDLCQSLVKFNIKVVEEYQLEILFLTDAKEQIRRVRQLSPVKDNFNLNQCLQRQGYYCSDMAKDAVEMQRPVGSARNLSMQSNLYLFKWQKIGEMHTLILVYIGCWPRIVPDPGRSRDISKVLCQRGSIILKRL